MNKAEAIADLRVLKEFFEERSNATPVCLEYAITELERFPEIIRCKDCKHWEYDVIFADGWCRGKQQGNPEWYCADAERRTNETG